MDLATQGIRNRRGRSLWLIAAATGALLALTSAPATANTLKTVLIPDRAGEIPSQWLNYYHSTPRANVLLPDGYRPNRRYPLLVLLAGLNGNYDSYVHAGDTVEFNGFKGIVVMPEGSDGWYTDWWNNGDRGNPAWESYELNEVIPYVLRHFPIRPGRRWHALAGISMGGLGASYLGGRLPGFFGTVASLSGFVDPQYSDFSVVMGPAASAVQNGDSDPYPVEGPPAGFYALGHDPAAAAANLAHTRVFQSTGDGTPASYEPGQLDPATLAGDLSSEKSIIYPMNKLFHTALLAAHVNVTYQVQPGGHDDPHFRRELQAMLKWGLFNPVAGDPTAWTNQTVATTGQLWGIGYRFARPPSQIVRFQRNSGALSVSAAGSAVTLTYPGGCTVRRNTPAVVRFSPRPACRRR